MPRRRVASSAGSAVNGRAESGVGGLLREHRLRAHLSQLELATRAGISVDAVAAIERGRRRTPRPYTIRALSEALGLDVAERAALAAATAAERVLVGVPRFPTPVTAIIGRKADTESVGALLTAGGARLVTLVGPGGVGKSRLAIELAGNVEDSFEDGVRWASLAPVADAAAVPAVVAAAMAVQPAPGRSVAEALNEQIGDRQQLVVLDNCEHLLGAVAQVVRSLLDDGPRVSFLLTSRERVHVAGERVWPVQPLAVPPDDSRPEDLDQFPATTLFLERARALDPDFSVALPDAPHLARLLRRLDGLPLAVELAAARTNVLTVAELADGIEASLSVLGAGSESAPSRQRTLHGAVDWSFELLAPSEQVLLLRLAVFSAGATREAIEEICIGDGLEATEILDLLDSLAAKSLVATRAIDGRTRYFMLRTIRQFLVERQDPTADATAAAHARYFCSYAESAAPQLRPTAEAAWLDRLDAEAANLRRAISWSLDGGDIDTGVRLAGALWPWCHLRGMYAEGRGWVERALELGDRAPTPQRARVLAGAAMMAFLQCEYDVARDRVEESRALFAELDDQAGVAWATERLGSLARERGDYEAAAAHHRASQAIFRELGDAAGEGRALAYLGFVAWLRQDLDAAQEYCDSSLRVLTTVGEQEGMAWALLSRGIVALYRGELESAEAFLERSLALSSQLGYQEGVAWSLNQLGALARRRGELERARELLDDSLEMHRALGDLWRAASVVEELAAVAAAGGQHSRAGQLLGVADAVRERISTPIPACELADHETTVALVRRSLGAAMFESAHWSGAATPLERVDRP